MNKNLVYLFKDEEMIGAIYFDVGVNELTEEYVEEKVLGYLPSKGLKNLDKELLLLKIIQSFERLVHTPRLFEYIDELEEEYPEIYNYVNQYDSYYEEVVCLSDDKSKYRKEHIVGGKFFDIRDGYILITKRMIGYYEGIMANEEEWPICHITYNSDKEEWSLFFEEKED